MVIKYNFTKRQLEKLYCDTANIYQIQNIFDMVTGLTKSQYQLLYEKIPCYISYYKFTANEDTFDGLITQTIKLFCDIQYTILPGSKIEVFKFAKPELKTIYSFSSPPVYYQNHQEIALELLQKVV